MPALDMTVNVWLDVRFFPWGPSVCSGWGVMGAGHVLYFNINSLPTAASAAGKRVQIPHKLVPFCYAYPSNALANDPDTPSRNGSQDFTKTHRAFQTLSNPIDQNQWTSRSLAGLSKFDVSVSPVEYTRLLVTHLFLAALAALYLPLVSQ